MTHDTPQHPETDTIPSFGTQLRLARQALGLDTKAVASQLRLPENVIIMLEADTIADELPVTFVRGYIKTYGHFLQLPETEILKALAPIQPKPPAKDFVPLSHRNLDPMNSGHYFMQLFSYLIGFTMIGLVSTWAYTHYSLENKIMIATSGTPSDTVQPTDTLTPRIVLAPANANPTAAAEPTLIAQATDNKPDAMQTINPATPVEKPMSKATPEGSAAKAETPKAAAPVIEAKPVAMKKKAKAEAIEDDMDELDDEHYDD